jgi:hypothetical protein
MDPSLKGGALRFLAKPLPASSGRLERGPLSRLAPAIPRCGANRLHALFYAFRDASRSQRHTACQRPTLPTLGLGSRHDAGARLVAHQKKETRLVAEGVSPPRWQARGAPRYREGLRRTRPARGERRERLPFFQVTGTEISDTSSVSLPVVISIVGVLFGLVSMLLSNLGRSTIKVLQIGIETAKQQADMALMNRPPSRVQLS